MCRCQDAWGLAVSEVWGEVPAHSPWSRRTFAALRRRDGAEEAAQFRSQRKLQTTVMLHFPQKVLPKARFPLIWGFFYLLGGFLPRPLIFTESSPCVRPCAGGCFQPALPWASRSQTSRTSKPQGIVWVGVTEAPPKQTAEATQSEGLLQPADVVDDRSVRQAQAGTYHHGADS